MGPFFAISADDCSDDGDDDDGDGDANHSVVTMEG